MSTCAHLTLLPPAARVQVVGPHARLSAVSWLDRVTIFPLTPLLNLLPAHPFTDRLLMPVRRCNLHVDSQTDKQTQRYSGTRLGAVQRSLYNPTPAATSGKCG